MTRTEFVSWFKEKAGFEKESLLDVNETYWRRMIDYADYIFDYVEINEESVVYKWENMYWGGSTLETREFTFEEFIEAYENDSLSY